MYRLARYDVSRHFADKRAQLIAQIVFGLLWTAALLALMMLVQLWMPLPGPFAFVFPAVVIATLYGHWQAGITALVASTAAIWYFILPNSVPLSFAATSPIMRMSTVAIVGILLLILADVFRATVARSTEELDREIERREMLLRELEHRTRNNFALVASLLDFQRRQSSSPEVIRALDHAISRVHTFADAYSQLDTSKVDGSDVDMQPYLSRLLDRMADALFGDEVSIEREIAGLALPSRKAVAIGLYVNEALTNCAKYAFPDGHGTVRVALETDNGGWRLTVLDDGVGQAENQQGSGTGLGAILFEALAAQAGARHQVTLPEKGRRLDLVSVG